MNFSDFESHCAEVYLLKGRVAQLEAEALDARAIHVFQKALIAFFGINDDPKSKYNFREKAREAYQATEGLNPSDLEVRDTIDCFRGYLESRKAEWA